MYTVWLLSIQVFHCALCIVHFLTTSVHQPMKLHNLSHEKQSHYSISSIMIPFRDVLATCVYTYSYRTYTTGIDRWGMFPGDYSMSGFTIMTVNLTCSDPWYSCFLFASLAIYHLHDCIWHVGGKWNSNGLNKGVYHVCVGVWGGGFITLMNRYLKVLFQCKETG